MLYNVTSNIQSNMVLNKGILELGAYAIPGVIMSNNKVEAREKAERSALLFSIAYLTPFVMLPLFNKTMLKGHRITDKFNGHEQKLMLVSKKYLTKDGAHLEKGINELLDDFKNNKKKVHEYPKINEAFQSVLKKFPDKEVLRKKLIKTHSKVLLLDFLITGSMMGAVYWSSNLLTKLKTGKSGFSAKFEMVDEKTLAANAKKHEQTQRKKILIGIGSLVGGSLAVALGLKKGLLAKDSSKFGNFVKKHADKFDYTDAIFMSRATFLGINIFGDVPNTLLACRDKEELKYNTLKNAAFLSFFFGGDLVLNNLGARVIDKTMGTKLIDDSKLKAKNSLWNKINAPLRSFKEIEKNEIKLSPQLLHKTQKAGVAMFWGNFVLLGAILGFGVPYILNKILRNDVAKEMQKKNKNSNP